MEQNNIEKQFKEVLRNRDIQPSAQAWDRLDSMLTVVEQKPKRNFKWFAIAATLIGFSIIGIVFMNSDQSIQPKELNDSIVNEIVRPTVVEENTILVEETTISLPSKPLVQSSPKPEKAKQDVSEINPKKDALLDLKSEEQVVLLPKEVSKAQQNRYVNAQLLLAEIESKEIIVVKEIISNSKIKVDPQALLSSAEQEVNESFRDKIIQSINKNYSSIKSTLANRNYE